MGAIRWLCSSGCCSFFTQLVSGSGGGAVKKAGLGAVGVVTSVVRPAEDEGKTRRSRCFSGRR